MLFTKIEIDIAKQIIKIGLSIMFIFAMYTISIKVFYAFDKVETKKEVIIAKPVVINVKKYTPLSLEIPDFNINTNIESPASIDVQVLDSALARNAVYYPGSGTPGLNNTLIFGHSSTFKIVINKAYKVFNNLKNVTPGALIYVNTQEGVHIYRTISVKRVSKYTSWIQFKSEKPMLTLATCDSFGKASDRWVLEAEYVAMK